MKKIMHFCYTYCVALTLFSCSVLPLRAAQDTAKGNLEINVKAKELYNEAEVTVKKLALIPDKQKDLFDAIEACYNESDHTIRSGTKRVDMSSLELSHLLVFIAGQSLEEKKKRAIALWDALMGENTIFVDEEQTRKQVVNRRINNKNWTILHYAAAIGAANIVTKLLEMRMVINARDSVSRTALHLASIQGHDTVVQAYADYREGCYGIQGYKQIYVNTMDKNEHTPLQDARTKGIQAMLTNMMKPLPKQKKTFPAVAQQLSVSSATSVSLQFMKDDTKRVPDDQEASLQSAGTEEYLNEEQTFSAILRQSSVSSATSVSQQSMMYSISFKQGSLLAVIGVCICFFYLYHYHTCMIHRLLSMQFVVDVKSV